MHQDCVYYSTMRLQPQPLCAEIPSDAEKYRAIQLKKPAFLPLKSPCASSRRLSAHALNRPPPFDPVLAVCPALSLGSCGSPSGTTGTTGVSPIAARYWDNGRLARCGTLLGQRASRPLQAPTGTTGVPPVDTLGQPTGVPPVAVHDWDNGRLAR